MRADSTFFRVPFFYRNPSTPNIRSQNKPLQSPTQKRPQTTNSTFPSTQFPQKSRKKWNHECDSQLPNSYLHRKRNQPQKQKQLSTPKPIPLNPSPHQGAPLQALSPSSQKDKTSPARPAQRDRLTGRPGIPPTDGPLRRRLLSGVRRRVAWRHLETSSYLSLTAVGAEDLDQLGLKGHTITSTRTELNVCLARLGGRDLGNWR